MLARRAASPADAGRALVIGLGGGPLPIYWHASLGFNVEAVELDPVVLELAWTRFGFLEKAEAPSLTVTFCGEPSCPDALDMQTPASVLVACPCATMDQGFNLSLSMWWSTLPTLCAPALQAGASALHCWHALAQVHHRSKP